MGFDDELIPARFLDRLDQQVAEVGLESRVDMDFWLLDGDDLIGCGEALYHQRENLADPESIVGESDLYGDFSASVYETQFK